MKKIRLVTLFSGYDSQAMALERIKQVKPDFDYELVRWCEIDENAIKAHDLCFPEYKGRNLGDITKVNWSKVKEEVGDIDLLTFSSPCQDFSAAGLMKGGERGSGTRSSLLWEVEKAIIALNPKFLMLENVKNLVSKKFKPLFFRWLRLLEDYGYKSYWKVLNAKDYGIPQNRERVFCISIRKDVSDAPYVFPEPFELKTKLKDVLEENVDDKYYLSEKSIEGFMQHNEKSNGFVWRPKNVNIVGTRKEEVASTIKASYYKVSIASFVHTDGRRATGAIEYDTDGGYSKDDTGRVL